MRRRLVVLRLEAAAREARAADEVDAAPALPGFCVRVGDLFEGL